MTRAYIRRRGPHGDTDHAGSPETGRYGLGTLQTAPHPGLPLPLVTFWPNWHAARSLTLIHLVDSHGHDATSY